MPLIIVGRFQGLVHGLVLVSEVFDVFLLHLTLHTGERHYDHGFINGHERGVKAALGAIVLVAGVGALVHLRSLLLQVPGVE